MKSLFYSTVKIGIVCLFVLAAFTSACDLFRPVGFAPRPVPGDMPARVMFRGSQESFNQRYFFSLRDGALWMRQYASSYGTDTPWICIGTWETPYKTLLGNIHIKWVDEISVDGVYIVLNVGSRVFWTLDGLKDISAITWFERWGFPVGLGSGFTFPRDYRAWSANYSNVDYQKYYTDGNGIKFVVYIGHVFLLDTNQTDIHFADGWMPRDWGYQIGGPKRGRFKAVSLSVSGSVLFVMNRYGDIFTCHTDFDAIGANPFLWYTYEALTIPDYSRVYQYEYPRKLPHDTWIRHTKIDGDITARMCIVATGEGQDACLLRIQGRSPSGGSGITGYFEKQIPDTTWSFTATNEYINPADYIENTLTDMSDADLGPSRDMNYSGIAGSSCSIHLSDFAFYSSPANLDFVSAEGQVVNCQLFYHIYYRPGVQYDIGSDGSPLILKGAIKVPDNISDLGFLRPLYDIYLQLKAAHQGMQFVPVDIRATCSRVKIFNTQFPGFEIWLDRN